MVFSLYFTDATPKRGHPKKTTVCLDDRYPLLSHNERVDPSEESSASEALHKYKAPQRHFPTINENNQETSHLA